MGAASYRIFSWSAIKKAAHLGKPIESCRRTLMAKVPDYRPRATALPTFRH